MPCGWSTSTAAVTWKAESGRLQSRCPLAPRRRSARLLRADEVGRHIPQGQWRHRSQSRQQLPRAGLLQRTVRHMAGGRDRRAGVRPETDGVSGRSEGLGSMGPTRRDGADGLVSRARPLGPVRPRSRARISIESRARSGAVFRGRCAGARTRRSPTEVAWLGHAPRQGWGS